VSANQESVSLLSVEPPDFPDLLYFFRQSLSVSQNLNHLVSEVEMPCVCRSLSHMNWTTFSEQHVAGEWLKECAIDSRVNHPVIAVGNWTLEPQPKTGGMEEQGRALIIGISAGLTIALSVGVILVLCR